MSNLNYRRGADKERRIVKKAREEGLIALRSAGSHSPIDVVIIDGEYGKIQLIQCKSSKSEKGGIPLKLKEKLEKKYNYLNNKFDVEFIAL